VRVYLPTTLPDLRRWRASGQAPPGPAAAVTPAIREWYVDADAEELEYAAQRVAARVSLELLAADPELPRRRCVLAADVPDADVATVDSPRGIVTVGTAVPTRQWASLLIDDEEADVVVSAAASALGAAADDADAAFTVDEAEATELGWYAIQELAELLGE
jgi:hypothetical protein